MIESSPSRSTSGQCFYVIATRLLRLRKSFAWPLASSLRTWPLLEERNAQPLPTTRLRLRGRESDAQTSLTRKFFRAFASLSSVIAKHCYSAADQLLQNQEKWSEIISNPLGPCSIISTSSHTLYKLIPRLETSKTTMKPIIEDQIHSLTLKFFNFAKHIWIIFRHFRSQLNFAHKFILTISTYPRSKTTIQAR